MLTDDDKAKMTVAAFGAAGAAVSLTMQRHDRNFKRRLAKGLISFVAGIACAVLFPPLIGHYIEKPFQIDPLIIRPILGFVFGMTGYETCKVIFFRWSKFLNRFADKKETELLGEKEIDTGRHKTDTQEAG